MVTRCLFFFFSSRRRHTRCLSDWSSDVCSSDLDDLLMQFQADILDRPVVRPVTKDATTALGAAYAAGLAGGYFKDLKDLRANWAVDRTWKPNLNNGKREEMYTLCNRAVSRSFDWVSCAESWED